MSYTKVIYFIPFKMKTFVAVSRDDISHRGRTERNKLEIDRATWSLLKTTLHEAVSGHHSTKGKFEEQMVRLMAKDEAGHKWYVDQEGVVVSTLGLSGKIEKKKLDHLGKVLFKIWDAK